MSFFSLYHSSMKTVINIQLSQSEMEKDFLNQLRNRTIPSHLSYWGKKEAQEWINVCKSEDYEVYEKGVELLKKNVIPKLDILKDAAKKGLNFLSLGIGNGVKDQLILEALLKLFKIRYFPVDISLDMINAGIKNMSVDVETVGFISDFRFLRDISERIRQNYYPCHLISILGNTIGNFGQIEILNNLRKGMSKKDFLLIEITMRKETGSKMHSEDLTHILESYNNEYYKSFVFAPLEKAGFRRTDGIIEVEYGPNQFYPKLYSIEIWFRLKKDKVAHYAGEDIVFKKDERILLYVSHKYTRENILELLDGNGFEVVKFIPSDDNYYGYMLCRLKEEK